MGLDVVKNPLLYSVGTQLSYTIAKHYYGNVHFVWCSTNFNLLGQPPTSNPATICRRYLEQLSTGDRHMIDNERNMVGVLNGARAKRKSRVITRSEYNNIRSIVNCSYYKDFFPVLYIIDSEKVKDRCIEVATEDKASDDSIEYRIEDLKEGEFDVIFFKDFLTNVIKVVDKKVGE